MPKAIADLTFDLKTMPAREGRKRINLTISEDAIHIFLNKQEVWIEVDDKGNLVARGYLDQKDEGYATITITRENISIEKVEE